MVPIPPIREPGNSIDGMGEVWEWGVPPFLSWPRQVANAPYGREARASVVGFVTVCIYETHGSQKKKMRDFQ